VVFILAHPLTTFCAAFIGFRLVL